jgi:parallel beta-helix repeat protein
MNSKRVLGLGLIALMLASPAWAAGKGPIQIKPPKTFPVVISQPGSYQLIGNLTVPAGGGNAINILANDVTLDLNGFTVQGTNGGVGIGISAGAVNQRNVTIKNGTVRGFASDGISLFGNGHIVTDVKAEANGLSGIDVFQGSIIERCTATGNAQHGINTGKGCAIKDNVCTTNTLAGIHAGQSCTILQNTCNGNGTFGVQVDQGSTIVQNTCSENTSVGIEMGGRCLAQQNSCFFNQIGIEDGGAGSQIKNNTCTLNSLAGIAVVSDCEISHNSCNRLNGIGIFCGGSNNSVVENTCLQNTTGIDLGNGGANYAAQNKLSANTTAIANSGGDTLGAGDLANVTF